MNKCMYCGAELTTGDVNGVCHSCRSAGLDFIFDPQQPKFPPMFPPFDPPYQPPTQYGWMCPRCGAVHAPFIPHCNCPPPTRTTDSTQLRIDFNE